MLFFLAYVKFVEKATLIPFTTVKLPKIKRTKNVLLTTHRFIVHPSTYAYVSSLKFRRHRAHDVFHFTENLGIKNPKLFEGDMILSSAQRLAAMKGLDVDEVTRNARGSLINSQWPGGVLIYSIDPQIGKEK